MTRDEIIKEVWPGTIVEFSNVPVQIAVLRRVLDRDREESSCIQTIPGRGYRFALTVTRGELYPNSDTPVVTLGYAHSPPRLSIVVLPFSNFSGDPEQQYFADAITDDLTTDLSRVAGMFVI